MVADVPCVLICLSAQIGSVHHRVCVCVCSRCCMRSALDSRGQEPRLEDVRLSAQIVGSVLWDLLIDCAAVLKYCSAELVLFNCDLVLHHFFF